MHFLRKVPFPGSVLQNWTCRARLAVRSRPMQVSCRTVGGPSDVTTAGQTHTHHGLPGEQQSSTTSTLKACTRDCVIT